MELLTDSRTAVLPRSSDAEAGFSLAELLVALLIVAFVVLGVLTAFGQGIKFNSSSRDYSAVSSLATSHLEELISLPFRAPELDPASTHTLQSPDARFTITYTVQEFSLNAQTSDPMAVFATTQTPGIGNVKRITLTVNPLNRTAPGQREVTVEAVKQVR
jgi:Tfp pilus assembly protein PilV